eukprot:951665_1
MSSDHFCAILEGIESGLSQIKTQQRKHLMISISVEVTAKHDPTFHAIHFTRNIGRIINALKASDVNDFMFILNLPATDDDTLDEMFRNVCNLSIMNTKVIRILRKFIITNEHCKINGYRE